MSDRAYEFVTTLTTAKGAVPDVTISLSVNERRAGLLTARYSCDAATAAALDAATDQDRHVRFRAEFAGIEISTSRAHLLGGERPIAVLDNRARRFSGDLRLHDLSVHPKEPGDPSPDRRQLTFYLGGNQQLWGSLVGAHRDLDEGGAGIEIPVDGRFPGKVHTSRAASNYAAPLDGRNVEIIEFSPVVYFYADEGHQDVDALVALAKPIVEDLCALATFASRSRVIWFRYDVDHDGPRMWRSVPDPGEGSDDFHEVLATYHGWGPLIHNSFENIHRRRNEGIDVTTAIDWLTLGHSASTVEESFAAYFLALEKLKDVFSDARKLSSTVRDGPWKRLRRAIDAVIDEHAHELDLPAQVKEAVLQIRRPTIRYVVEQMSLEFNVDLGSLYPSGIEPTLFSTRNKMFHSNADLAAIDVQLEMLRAQTLVEQLILRILGFPPRTAFEPGQLWALEFVRATPQSPTVNVSDDAHAPPSKDGEEGEG